MIGREWHKGEELMWDYTNFLSPEEIEEMESVEAAAEIMRKLEAGTFYNEHEEAIKWIKNRGWRRG